jgi:uracil-xanthine permease
MKKFIGRIRDYFHEAKGDNLFRLDGAVPLNKAIPFGFQHVLAMFVANIAPLFIVLAAQYQGVGLTKEVTENAIRSAIFVAAIGTTVQLFPIWRIGSKLPIVVGLSFTFVGVLYLIATTYGFPTMFISVIIGGLFIGVLGLFAKYWRRFIKPIVAACVVLGIGLSLLLVGIDEFIASNSGTIVNGVYDFSKGWPYLVVAFSALASSLLFYIFMPGVWKNINILAGLIIAYLVALCFQGTPYAMIDFGSMIQGNAGDVTNWINVPRPIFTLMSFSWGDFNIGAILSVCLIYLVATTEGIGDLSSLANAGLGRDPTDQEISGGLSCDGFTSALAGCFGALPLTTFTQNVGIVGQTKVVNRFTILQGTLLLFAASLFPMVSRFLMTIPEAVLGGCMVNLFASIVVIGMQMLAKCGWSQKNVTIASLALGLGYGITLVPAFTANTYTGNLEWLNYLMLIMQNPVANMFIISLILSYVLPERMNGPKGPEEAPASEESKASTQLRS